MRHYLDGDLLGGVFRVVDRTEETQGKIEREIARAVEQLFECLAIACDRLVDEFEIVFVCLFVWFHASAFLLAAAPPSVRCM